LGLYYVQHHSPHLRQGEIINNLLEFKLQIPGEKSAEEILGNAKLDPIFHPYVIVISQDCDLEFDYKARCGQASKHKVLIHTLFCGLFTRDEIVDETKRKSEAFGRIKDGQDERYHYLACAPVNETDDSLPELIADFKNTFSLPTEFVYWLVATAQIARKGELPSPYLEDFMHRAYSFLGRVATPPIT
jgi:hypothetical protein